MAGAAHAEILIGSVSIVHEKAGLNKVLNDRLGPKAETKNYLTERQLCPPYQTFY